VVITEGCGKMILTLADDQPGFELLGVCTTIKEGSRIQVKCKKKQLAILGLKHLPQTS